MLDLDLPLVADGVVIDHLEASDAAALAVSHSDPDNARFQGWASPLSVSEAVAFIDAQAADWPVRSGGGVQLALRAEPGGDLVGDLYLASPADEPGDVDVGITLVPGCHGRGFATAAIELVATTYLASPGRRLVAFVDEANDRSRRLFERCGFELVDRAVEASRRRDGTIGDELTFVRRARDDRA